MIWAVSMVRDEEDVIETVIRHLLAEGVDRVLVADNLSRDRTREILERLSSTTGRVDVVDDPDPAYRQAEKMTRLAHRAGELGAQWIIPFDADEIWHGSQGTLEEALTDSAADVVAAQMFDHYPRPTWRRGDFRRRMPWARVAPFPKVAFRWHPGAVLVMGNHDVRGVSGQPEWGRLFIEHYPHRSWRQYRRKIRQGAAALQQPGVEEWLSEFHWNQKAEMPDWRLRVEWWKLRLEPRLRLRDRHRVRGGRGGLRL